MPEAQTVAVASQTPFLEEALALGNDLTRTAVAWGEYANWVGRRVTENPRDPKAAMPCADALGGQVYRGSAGIALFLGHLGRFSGDPAHHDAARGAILEGVRQARQSMSRDERDSHRREMWGFYSGVLGVAWAAHELAQILGDAYVAQRAAPLLDLLRQNMEAKTETDLIGGHAGAIPALLSLHREHRVEGARELALALGERALACATRTDTGALAWKRTFDTVRWPAPLTGFSHGAAGYAYALALLHCETADGRWKDAALRALQYERERFIPARSNWPDLRYPPDAKGEFTCKALWCHGAGGIGVSRVLIHRALQDEPCLAEARHARQSLGRFTRERIEHPGDIYQLCHGVNGNLECLWILDAGLGTPRALARAREAGLYGIERFGAPAKARGRSRFTDWPTGHPGHRDLSLMTGIAGIGYTCLRLHAPDRVPTVLAPGISWKRAADVPYQSPDERQERLIA